MKPKKRKRPRPSVELPQKKPAKLRMEKPQRNQLCPCGSGKKYKRCCARRFAVQPAVKPAPMEVPPPEVSRVATCRALLRAKVAPAHVWAYYENGFYIPENSRTVYSTERLECWDTSVDSYLACEHQEQDAMISKATGL